MANGNESMEYQRKEDNPCTEGAPTKGGEGRHKSYGHRKDGSDLTNIDFAALPDHLVKNFLTFSGGTLSESTKTDRRNRFSHHSYSNDTLPAALANDKSLVAANGSLHIAKSSIDPKNHQSS
jgi:hypothetical protein